MSTLADQVDIVIGIDTHRDTHNAALVAPTGAELQGLKVPATKTGYNQLLKAVEGWPRARRVWAIEGTASYGELGCAGCYALPASGSSKSIIRLDRPARTVPRPTLSTPKQRSRR